MKSFQLSFLSILAILSSSSAQTNERCNICGPELMVGAPDAEVNGRTCAELQALGDDGVLNPTQCTELQGLALAACDCINFVCFICGMDKNMTKPDGLVSFPGDDRVTDCANVENGALLGAFGEDECINVVQPLVEEPCGCEAVPIPTSEPTSAPSISAAPSRSPVDRPTRMPTMPTIAPVSPPTPVGPPSSAMSRGLVASCVASTGLLLALLY